MNSHQHTCSYLLCFVRGAKKQSTVALSMAEAEYITMMRVTKEAIWIRQFMGELFGNFTMRTILQVDSQSPIAMAQNNLFHFYQLQFFQFAFLKLWPLGKQLLQL